MTEPKFMPGPYNAVIEDHPVCDTGEWYTSYVVFTEKNGKDVAIAEVFAIDDDYDEATANTHLLAAAPDGYEYAETTAEILQLLLETFKLPEQARKCLQERIDESEKYRKKARGEE